MSTAVAEKPVAKPAVKTERTVEITIAARVAPYIKGKLAKGRSAAGQEFYARVKDRKVLKLAITKREGEVLFPALDSWMQEVHDNRAAFVAAIRKDNPKSTEHGAKASLGNTYATVLKLRKRLSAEFKLAKVDANLTTRPVDAPKAKAAKK